MARLNLLWLLLAAQTIQTVWGAGKYGRRGHHGNGRSGTEAQLPNGGRHDNTTRLQMQEAQIYIGKLFDKYGKGEVMTFEGFEHFLQSIGVGSLHIDDHDIHDHLASGDFHLHGDHKHGGQDGKPPNGLHGEGGDGRHGEGSEGRHGEGGEGHHGEGGEGHHGESGEGHHGESGEGRHGEGGEGHRGDPQDRTSGRQGATSRRSGRTGRVDGLSGGRRGRAVRAVPAHSHEHQEKQCLRAEEIMALYELHMGDGVSQKNFLYMCPALLFQVDGHLCLDNPLPCVHTHDSWLDHCALHHGQLQRGGSLGQDHDTQDHGTQDHNQTEHMTKTQLASFSNISAKVWGYGLLAVTVISLVGLACVAIIPLINGTVYHQVIQLLVAMAIGTLTGDALLHLLPHALANGHQDSHGDTEDAAHRDGIWKGLCALLGIYLFFLAERLLALFSQRQRRKRTTTHAVTTSTKRPAFARGARVRPRVRPRLRPSVRPRVRPRPDPGPLASMDTATARRDLVLSPLSPGWS